MLKRLLLGCGLLSSCLVLLAGCEPTNQGYEPDQPVVYSHAVHAGELQVPCQYCHYAAERGPVAGIPPASVCMNCHTQVIPDHPEIAKLKLALTNEEPIAWVRVHRLPDHAFFDHSAHVVTGELACQDCHGEIESMGRVRQEAPLTMGWCIDCHRQKGSENLPLLAGVLSNSRPDRANRLTDCSVCHH